MTISLPLEMVREVDRIRRKEGRTRSELVREALRRYASVAQLPVYHPSKRELRELKKGRKEMRKGAYFTLNEFRTRLVASSRKEIRRKKSSARAKA